MHNPMSSDQNTPEDLTTLLSAGGWRIFHGDLHNHTSYSDGMGNPAQALAQMHARGLHFGAITEHGEFFDRSTALHNAARWIEIGEAADARTTEGFVAIRGFEWTSPLDGHICVWWSADYTNYLRAGDPATFGEWLAAAHGVGRVGAARPLAGFNHPGREPGNSANFKHTLALNELIVTAECFNRDLHYGAGYFDILDRGWHVGAIGCADHHAAEWGCPSLPRTGVLATALTREALQEALAAKRTFASRVPDLRLALTGNNRIMGSRFALIPTEQLTLILWCDARQAMPACLEICTNRGEVIATAERRLTVGTRWSIDIDPLSAGERWYVARLSDEDGALAYSSPVWARWEAALQA